MTQIAGRLDEYQNFVFFLSQTEGDEDQLLLNPVRRPRLFMSTVIQPPVVPGASPSAPLTLDSGSNQKPHGLRLNAHPLDHVGDEISMEMCVYIALNTLNHQRT